MFQLLAVCPMGLEAVVAREIQELGYETNVENGRIFFEENKCNCRQIYGCAQQTESKLLLDVLTQQRFNDQFQQTKALPWESIIDKEGNFPVQGNKR